MVSRKTNSNVSEPNYQVAGDIIRNSPRLQAGSRPSWWQRFMIFCCSDASNEVGKPESSAVPDNIEFHRPIHGQVSTKSLAWLRPSFSYFIWPDWWKSAMQFRTGWGDYFNSLMSVGPNYDHIYSISSNNDSLRAILGLLGCSENMRCR